MPSESWASCDCLLTILTYMAFTQQEFLYAAKEKCMCKCLSTLFTTGLLFLSVKYYVFINFHIGGIRLSTLNTHTAKWLFLHIMSKNNGLSHGCFSSRHYLQERAACCLTFSLKCIAHEDNKSFFPKKSLHWKYDRSKRKRGVCCELC